MFNWIFDLIEKVIEIVRNILWGICVFLMVVFSIGIAISYPWTCVIIVPLAIGIIVLLFNDSKKSTTSPTTTYVPRNLRAIADEKRNYMYEMYKQYEVKKKELESLELRKESMDDVTYETEYARLMLQVNEKKRYYDQAADAYRAAELEAP